MDKLKPCPFCGGEARLEQSGVFWFVKCISNTDCYTESAYDLGQSGAIERWNTRPIEDAQAAEIERLREANRWIPVSEEMPEPSISILVANAGKTYMAMYLAGQFLNRTGQITFTGVTHWRPLPEPPQ